MFHDGRQGYQNPTLEQLTESSKMSNLTKEEFEAYQKVYHKEYDHNAMVDGIFEEFADEINAKVASSVQDREREMARNMLAEGDSVEKVSRITKLSEREALKLKKELEETEEAK